MGDFVVKIGSRHRQSDIFTNTDNIQAQVHPAYLWEPSLIVASLGHHTQLTFQKHLHLGPQMTTSNKTPVSSVSDIWRFCTARHWLLLISMEAKQDPSEAVFLWL